MLESHENLFTPLIVAHLQSQATRNDPAQRSAWKMRLFRALFQRNLTAEEIRELLRIVDWFLDLPPQVEQQFRHDYRAWKEEQRMPFVPSFERFAREEGIELGRIEVLLELNFGEEGLALMPDVRKITDFEKLRNLARSVRTVKTLEEFRALLPS